MGIDCPNIRQVIHLGIPEDTKSYLQETGESWKRPKPFTSTFTFNEEKKPSCRKEHVGVC